MTGMVPVTARTSITGGWFDDPKKNAVGELVGRTAGHHRRIGLREGAGPGLHMPSDRRATSLREVLPAEPGKENRNKRLRLPANWRSVALREVLPPKSGRL